MVQIGYINAQQHPLRGYFVHVYPKPHRIPPQRHNALRSSDPTFAAHSKAAFSSNPAHDFDDEDDDRDAEFRSGRRSTEASGGGVGGGPSSASSLGYHRRDPDDEYALLHNSDADDLGGPHGTPAPPPFYDPTRDNAAHNNNNININSTIPLPGSGDATTTTSYLHDYDTSYGGAYEADIRPQQPTGSFHDRYADR
ncbi:hypothetical protein ACJ72_00348 [Emergomyces africanus]|uniref:Uncharacterized protein n=1 Tax=Emergomyces africanus TaxID=1955775 RepID=A0A1B7P8A0_9EURO|nr:hypothetical protein ACJ72_00348 [Emergomyces africanus]